MLCSVRLFLLRRTCDRCDGTAVRQRRHRLFVASERKHMFMFTWEPLCGRNHSTPRLRCHGARVEGLPLGSQLVKTYLRLPWLEKLLDIRRDSVQHDTCTVQSLSPSCRAHAGLVNFCIAGPVLPCVARFDHPHQGLPINVMSEMKDNLLLSELPHEKVDVHTEDSFRRDMLRTANVLVMLEAILQPIMFAIGYGVHGNGIMVFASYFIQVSAILFSLWLQRKILQNPPLEGSWCAAVDTLMGGTVKVAGFDVPYLKKIDYEVLLNYSIYWAGMADSLSAGQSWYVWTPGYQSTWVRSWSEVPLLGGILGFLAQWCSIPHMLTLLSTINYILLILAMVYLNFDRSGVWRPNADSLFNSNTDRSMQELRGEKGLYDVGNLPLFSAVCSCHLAVVGQLDYLGMRHLWKVCLIAAPHTWLKMDLLAMSWVTSRWTQKLNLMFAIFLQMTNKVISVIEYNKEVYEQRRWPHTVGCRSLPAYLFWFFLFLLVQWPLFVFLGCCWKLMGICLCKSHYINVTTGCV